jgi:hypothetical protein
MNHVELSGLSLHQLNRMLVHARNKRDAFPVGREPERVLRDVRMLITEINNRRCRVAQASRKGC